MSRSYRKAFCTQGYKRPRAKQFWKKEANGRVRRAEDVPNGKAYRRLLNPWMIDDWCYYQSPYDINKYWPEWWKLLRK